MLSFNEELFLGFVEHLRQSNLFSSLSSLFLFSNLSSLGEIHIAAESICFRIFPLKTTVLAEKVFYHAQTERS